MDIELSPEILNAALRLSLDPAHSARKWIREPLRQRMPTLTEEEAEEADVVCGGLKRTVFKWIERVHRGLFSESETRQMIADEYPWIDAENLSHLWSQGMYFACRG